MKPKIKYKFVPHGTTAPEPVAVNALWIDVGNKAVLQVLDHHGGDTNAKSAFELILKEYKKFIIPPLAEIKELTFVLHTSPDLDAICSAWLAEKILNTPEKIDQDFSLKKIEKAVSENDQGLVRTKEPKSNWAIVMRTILMTEYSQFSDFSKLKAALKLVEKTYIILQKNGSFEDAAKTIIFPKIENTLDKAQKEYSIDISKADIFQTDLPKMGTVCEKNFLSPKRINRKIADAVTLYNPISILFKELVRGDVINSPQKQGFDLLIVVRDIKLFKNRALKRYIISTDPLSGFHLKGLGAKLEQLEQIKEEKIGLPLLKGRERVDKGLGRYGSNVKASWYDGRGHDYTIVDSPAVEDHGKIYCVSCLTIHEIISALNNFAVLKKNR